MPKITKKRKEKKRKQYRRRREKRLILYYDYSQSQHCDTYNITALITYQFHNPSTLLLYIYIHILGNTYIYINVIYIFNYALLLFFIST